MACGWPVAHCGSSALAPVSLGVPHPLSPAAGAASSRGPCVLLLCVRLPARWLWGSSQVCQRTQGKKGAESRALRSKTGLSPCSIPANRTAANAAARQQQEGARPLSPQGGPPLKRVHEPCVWTEVWQVAAPRWWKHHHTWPETLMASTLEGSRRAARWGSKPKSTVRFAHWDCSVRVCIGSCAKSGTNPVYPLPVRSEERSPNAQKKKGESVSGSCFRTAKCDSLSSKSAQRAAAAAFACVAASLSRVSGTD